MKIAERLCLLAVLALGGLAAHPAFAQWHHGWGGPRVGIGINFGVPIYAPYYYSPPPYYYAPPPYYYPPVLAAPAPSQYIEQPAESPAPAAQPAPQSRNSWYYCAQSSSYYPYVKECPGGWQPVSPTPPAR